MKFLAELKRRNVIRMAGLYLVGAWLLIQIAETRGRVEDWDSHGYPRGCSPGGS